MIAYYIIEEELKDFIKNEEIVIDKPIEKTIEIDEDSTGHSFKNLYRNYLLGAKDIYLEDPNIRIDYQVRNLLSFCELFDTSKGTVHFKLITNYTDYEQKETNVSKLDQIKKALQKHDIVFEYEFDKNAHDRLLILDNGWKIIPGRGLDIFKAPEYGLFQDEQTERKCRKCRIEFVKN